MKTSAIEQMTKEHKHIASVIAYLDTTAKALRENGQTDLAKLRQVVEFFRIYADQRHHHREEALFFPVLVKNHGVPAQGCPIGGLNHGHEKGREYMDKLTEKLHACKTEKECDQAALAELLEEIAGFYRHHLWMEDEMVFPMGERFLTEEENNTLLKEFDMLDTHIGQPVIERLEKFAVSVS